MAKSNSKTTNTSVQAKSVRPTKKQHELLEYLREFIAEHGYSPSYREIMRGCNYTSVATVALHVNNLIKRGHVIKRDKSARSLEVVSQKSETAQTQKSNHKHELIKEIDERFVRLEQAVENTVLNEAYVLIGALKILGHQDMARAYATRINQVSSMKQ